MNSLVAMEEWDHKLSERQYDCILATAGYESRATFAFKTLKVAAQKRTAWGFDERNVLAFHDNVSWFRENGYEVQISNEADVEGWSEHWLSEIANHFRAKEVIKICIDISSLSRRRLASILAALIRVPSGRPFKVDFLYSIAKWNPPSEEVAPIVSANPVLPFFAGFSERLDLPSVAVIGLGYEPDKAVGAFEYLEAADVWVFYPISLEDEYTRDVGRANKSLLPRVRKNQQISYRVDQPLSCFGRLDGLINRLQSRTRPVLLPFGPKVFALCALLVGCHRRETPVWHFSSGQYGDPVDRVGSKIVGLKATFTPDGSQDGDFADQ